jgi:hypothetical protein
MYLSSMVMSLKLRILSNTLVDLYPPLEMIGMQECTT